MPNIITNHAITYRAFSLTWPASMQIYWNKRERLHKKRVQLPQDWFDTPTWPPFHFFGTPIWPPWRYVKTLYTNDTQRSFVFSYLDFRVYFASYPPESFKIICLTCIWLKFVDTSFHSSQKPPQLSAASVAILNRWEALNFLWAKCGGNQK